MQLSSLVVEGTGIIGFSQETLQAQQYCLNVVHRTPLILQNVKTDSTAEVNVGVVDRRLEEDGGRRVWVVRGKLKGKLETQIGVWRVFRSNNGGGPV